MGSVEMGRKKQRKSFASFQIIFFGFSLLILGGGLLLMLPVSSASGEVTPFVDALFTATSASCVTGLIVYDTATHWSAFGQAVILTLIQIGGLGVVTMVILFFMASKQKIGLSRRITMQESISAPQLGGILKLTKYILKFVVVAELFGALLLAPAFWPEFGFLKGCWYGLFHSVSAFCNAGFDLMGVKEPFSSLTSYSGNIYVNCVIMLLIIIGGIGFLTWDDIKNYRFRFGKYRLQTKIILSFTVVLILLPAVYYFFAELLWWDIPMHEKVIASLFQSVTTRTAGFNTVAFGDMSENGQLVTVVLMLTGGAPGSTAGGMKVTTFAVLIIAALAVFKRKQSPEAFGRRLAPEAVTSATAIFLLYISMALMGAMVISSVENLPMMTALFETASAVGTAGLTLGVTPGFSVMSKVILILLMFFGRVGGLTFVYVFMAGRISRESALPEEKIVVG